MPLKPARDPAQGRRGSDRGYFEPLISNRRLRFSSLRRLEDCKRDAGGRGWQALPPHGSVLLAAPPNLRQPSVNNVVRLLRRIQAAMRDTGCSAHMLPLRLTSNRRCIGMRGGDERWARLAFSSNGLAAGMHRPPSRAALARRASRAKEATEKEVTSEQGSQAEDHDDDDPQSMAVDAVAGDSPESSWLEVAAAAPPPPEAAPDTPAGAGAARAPLSPAVVLTDAPAAALTTPEIALLARQQSTSSLPPTQPDISCPRPSDVALAAPQTVLESSLQRSHGPVLGTNPAAAPATQEQPTEPVPSPVVSDISLPLTHSAEPPPPRVEAAGAGSSGGIVLQLATPSPPGVAPPPESSSPVLATQSPPMQPVPPLVRAEASAPGPTDEDSQLSQLTSASQFKVPHARPRKVAGASTNSQGSAPSQVLSQVPPLSRYPSRTAQDAPSNAPALGSVSLAASFTSAGTPRVLSSLASLTPPPPVAALASTSLTLPPDVGLFFPDLSLAASETSSGSSHSLVSPAKKRRRSTEMLRSLDVFRRLPVLALTRISSKSCLRS
jgi:hypothetical protein